MTGHFSQILKQERLRLLRAAAGVFEGFRSGENSRTTADLMAVAGELRKQVNDVLIKHAAGMSKEELIRLQSALHSALDEQIQQVLGGICERRFSALSEMARRDSLTGLPNRAAFDDRLKEEVTRAARYRRGFSLVLFDIDGFKSVNDGFGHQAGDKVLSAVARALLSTLRQSDAVFRYGGDEFAAICPETSGVAVESMLRRLETNLKAISANAGLPLAVGVSWGIATLPVDAENADELMQLADQRLYSCKNERHRQITAQL